MAYQQALAQLGAQLREVAAVVGTYYRALRRDHGVDVRAATQLTAVVQRRILDAIADAQGVTQ